WLILFAACLILVGVGSFKVYLALERGRTNVQFLLGLMVFAPIIVAKVSFPRLTAMGRSVLADVQSLYSGLKDRASLIRPGGATIEPMMLAAAFGISALAGGAFSYTETLFPQPKRS